MDKAAREQELRNEKLLIEEWIKHPLTQKLLTGLDETAEGLASLVLNQQVKDLGSLVAHFEATGHRHGINYVRDQVNERLDEIEKELKEL